MALEQALGLGSASTETETERMIRQGEMTPFGTVVTNQPGTERPASTGPRLSTGAEMTSFEKYLMDQQQKGSTRKKQPTGKKSTSEAKDNKATKNSDSAKRSSKEKKTKLTKSHSSPALTSLGDKSASSRGGADRPNDRPNLFDAKDKRTYRPSEKDFSTWRSGRPRFARLSHNFSGDGRLSDNEEYADDETYCKDGDYIPPAEDLVGDDSDYLSDHTPSDPSPTKGRTKRARKRAATKKPTGASSGDEGATPRKKRDTAQREDVSVKRARDDGDFDNFKQRIR